MVVLLVTLIVVLVVALMVDRFFVGSLLLALLNRVQYMNVRDDDSPRVSLYGQIQLGAMGNMQS